MSRFGGGSVGVADVLAGSTVFGMLSWFGSQPLNPVACMQS